MGDITKLTLALRGDGYSTDGDPQTLGQANDESTAGRIVPRVTVDWRWPFVSDQVPFVDAASGWRQTLEPLVSATWTPDGGNSQSIPNEDSIDLEFDDTNLFEVNKHPGLDRVDQGARVNYGLRFGAHSADNRHISGLVGQAFYVSDNPEFTKDSGLADNLSDYVGRVQLQPHEIFDLNYRFRADRSSLELKLSDLSARFEPGPFRFDLGYLQVANEEITDSQGFKRRKELTAGIRVRLNEEWSVSARTRQDLSENRRIVTTYGIVYDNPCLVLVAGIKDDNTEDRDAGSGVTFTLRITLKQLGEINTGSASTF
jgi:LPS-assembly protein